jgi:quercetin dioxygenase-like cupin family protein
LAEGNINKTWLQHGQSLEQTAFGVTVNLKFFRRFAMKGIRKMDIKRSGTQPSSKGQAEYFTGNVRIDPLFQPNHPTHASGASVTFEPGARTAWHTHLLGQTLIVTAGCGRIQRWGGPLEEIRPGDVVWAPPGEKHWHGAAPTTAMTHISIVEQVDGKSADWMEHISDEQYLARLEIE